MRSQVAGAPAGTQIAILDIDAAFRNIPLLPSHKPYTVIQCEEGQFYIDHVVCFGIASGVGLQGAVMDALVDVLEALGIGPNEKWVDDLINFRYPISELSPGVYVYGHDIDDIFDLSCQLRVPWSAKKSGRHGTVGIYLGFLWNMLEKSVSLPEEKRVKYLAKIRDALDALEGGRKMPGKVAISLAGTLSHIAFVYPQGRAYLSNLYAFVASFGPRPSEFISRWPPRSVISDLHWWREVLGIPGIKRTLHARGKPRDLDIWVDASTDWGIGVVVGQARAAWRWAVPLSEWKREGRDIGWAEMVAVELVVRHLEQLGMENADILVRSDNSGIIGAFQRGRSRNFQVNNSIRRTEAICMAMNLWITLQYVTSANNRADPVSRGIPDARLASLPIKFELPCELSPFLVLDA